MISFHSTVCFTLQYNCHDQCELQTSPSGFDIAGHGKQMFIFFLRLGSCYKLCQPIPIYWQNSAADEPSMHQCKLLALLGQIWSSSSLSRHTGKWSYTQESQPHRYLELITATQQVKDHMEVKEKEGNEMSEALYNHLQDVMFPMVLQKDELFRHKCCRTVPAYQFRIRWCVFII